MAHEQQSESSPNRSGANQLRLPAVGGFVVGRRRTGSQAGSQPGSAGNSGRVLLIVLVLLLVAGSLTWMVLRQARPARIPALPAPGAGLVQTAPGPQLARTRSATAPAGKPVIAYHLSAQRILAYGRAEGEVGMVLGGGQPPVGPESFALGKDGTVLVADVVNQRVSFYDSNGTYLRSLSLPGVALGDVITDEQGKVYVYDQVRRTLHQYDADGTPRSTLDLKPKDIYTRGYFHIAGDAVYFADAAARDVLVAVVREGVVVAPDQATERKTDGIHGESGRIYSLSVDKGQALRLQVSEPPMALPDAPTLQVPLPGIVSARYAGEDEARRFYVQTERLEGTRIALEVLTFNPAGELLVATPMPENDYAIWTAKLLDVRRDGTIVQFLPQKDQAKLNLFTN